MSDSVNAQPEGYIYGSSVVWLGPKGTLAVTTFTNEGDLLGLVGVEGVRDFYYLANYTHMVKLGFECLGEL